MGITISIIGSTTLKGQALRDLMPTSGLDIADVKLMDEDELVGTLTEYDGGAEIISRLTAESLEGSDLVFLCGSPSHSSKCIELLRGKSVVVIDLSDRVADEVDAPPVTSTLPAGRELGTSISLPESLAVGLATILDCCMKAGELELAAATCLVPTSDLGKKGNESLHAQVVELMNFGNIPDDIFGRQLIFNIHPFFGEAGGRGRSAFEDRIDRQISLLLPQKTFPLALSAARVPLFYGTSVSLLLKFRQSVKEEDFRKVLSDNPLIDLSGYEASVKTVPSTIDSGEKSVYQVGRLISMDDEPSVFLMWFSFDNIFRGAVLEAIALAKERLERGY
jgi:aspartate-semialdehyde dehydrogenase